jgi:CheY-like chemotaxis protein
MEQIKTILVVEDDGDIRDSLFDLLEDEGFRCVSVHDGREALTILEQGTTPDVIVFDLMMPVMDGYEFREHLMKNRNWKSIPTVILSADSRDDEKLEELGANVLLRKPMNAISVLSAIRNCIYPA